MPHSLIVDNPYRVLGTSTSVSNKTLYANYRSLMTRALKGVDSSLGQDMTTLVEPPLRTPYRLDQAKSKLNSAKGRLFHSLFWFIDTNKIDHAALYYLAKDERDKTMKILMSHPNFSSLINLAVIAFSEDRFKDAMQYYSRVFNDENMTQEFINHVIGSQYKVKGVYILSKIATAMNEEQKRLESEDNADERSLVGSGHGVLKKETQNKPRLLTSNAEAAGLNHLKRRKQTRKFDKHLGESFDHLVQRISDINREYGFDEADFVEVDVSLTPAARLVLSELQLFFDKNYALIEAFKNRCLEVNEKSLYLDYIYDLVSLVHYVYHLYIVDLGRMYSNALVQQLRSFTAKLERLYFRIKSDDIDYLVASLKRVGDTLPYINQITSIFENYYVMQEPANMVKSFYAFHDAALKVLEDYAKQYGLGGAYIDCSLHLQDLLVRLNVTFMSAMTSLAIQSPAQPKDLKSLVAVQKSIDLQEAKAYQDKNKKVRQQQIERQLDLNDKERKEQDAVLPDHYQSSNPNRQPYVEPTDNLVDNYFSGGPDQEPQNAIDQQAEAQAEAAAAQNGQGPASGNQFSNIMGNTWVQNAQASGNIHIQGQIVNGYGQKVLDPKLEKSRLKEFKKAQKAAEKKKRAEREKASSLMRRCLSKERSHFANLLKRFESYSVSPNTMYLIKVVKQQVDRLPPPIGVKALLLGTIFIAFTAGVVYFNYWLSNS